MKPDLTCFKESIKNYVFHMNLANSVKKKKEILVEELEELWK